MILSNGRTASPELLLLLMTGRCRNLPLVLTRTGQVADAFVYMSDCETRQFQLSERTVTGLVRLLMNAKIIPDADEQNSSTTVITVEHRRDGALSAPTPPAVETPYLTLAEAAAYCRCARKTITNHLCQGNLRAMPASRPLRFRREDLDEWLSTRRRPRK